MTEPVLGRAEGLFLELANLEPAARAARLEECRRSDPELAAEVGALLGCHDRAEGFLQSGELREVAASLEETLPANSRLGDYTILGVLGTGGMGVVYVAEQERPRRTVALKLIRRGLGGKSLLRRFEHEAEVLGRLQHPGIAQIYEAGAAETGGGLQPFIAMELIRGHQLLEHANRGGLDHAARLALVARVCDAVQHAHQRGFIHRDLKPANILVNEEGDPKILDFGIARATDADLRINTLQTDAGQLIGTLPYMSPEQFSGTPEEVDSRADVYALGVILHELLTGSLPFDVRGRSIAEVAAMVREDDPPRVGTAHRALRGDAETIVLRALEKDKARRYQSAAEFGADIRRYLAGEPIEAKRDSAMYVIRKQLRRHRAVASAAAALLVALVAFSVVVSVQLRRNSRLARAEAAAKTEALLALDAARAARGRADETAERLREELTASSLEQGRLLGRAGNLSAAEDLIWPEYLRDPDSPHAYWGLWELYWRNSCALTSAAHGKRVVGIAALAGGTRFATAGLEGVVKVWDTGTLGVVTELRSEASELISLAASPTEPVLAVGHRDGSVVVWNLATDTQSTIAAAPASVRGLAFSSDGSLLVTGGTDGVGRVWTSTGELVRELSKVPHEIGRVTVGPDGTIAIVALDTPVVYVWPPGASEPASLPAHAGFAICAAFSPDGRMIATGGSDRIIRLWDAATLQPIRSFGGRNGSIMSLIFSRDSKELVTSGYWAVETWVVESGERRLSLPSHMAVPVAAVSGDERFVIAGTDDGVVRLWDTTRDVGVTRLGPHQGRTAAEISPSGRLIVTGDEAGTLRVWDAADGSLLNDLAAHAGRIKAVKFHPGGRLVATVGDDRLLRVWDLATGGMLHSFGDCESVSTWSCAFSNDGTRLASAAWNGAVVVRDVKTGAEVATLATNKSQVVSIRFTPDDSAIVTIDRTFTIRVWAPDGAPLGPFERPSIQPWTVSFTPDGRTMVAGSWARTVEVWDFETRRRVAELRGHSALISRVELNPADPAVAASAGNDGTLGLWDIPSRRPLASMELFGGWDVTTVSWAADGRRLIAGGADGTVAIIDPSAVDRYIAGNASHNIMRARERGQDGDEAGRVEAWARRALSAGPGGPAAAPGKGGDAAGEVTPGAIRGWTRGGS